MIIKVCGMREPSNIMEVAASKPDLMGFIFYTKSQRFVGQSFDPSIVKSVMPEIQTVGVFVNELPESLSAKVHQFGFDFVQLHGSESPVYCRDIRKKCKVLKAFGIHENIDWTSLMPYTGVCDYFLFDTCSAGHGGSGMKFNWQVLSGYKIPHPFFLSGGIGPDDVADIKGLQNPYLAGIDINSKFEVAPGLKDPRLLNKFITNVRS